MGQAGTTWVHRCPGWQLPTCPYLGEKTIPRSYRILGTPQYKRMKVTGQVWHRCEPGSHSHLPGSSSCSPRLGTVSVHPEGRTGGIGVCLAVALATGSGPSWGDSPLSNQHRNEEASQDLGHRSVFTHSSCCSQLWPLQNTGNSQLSHYEVQQTKTSEKRQEKTLTPWAPGCCSSA